MGGIYLRVISGLRKGHRLKVPRGTEVRPTEDRVKESLFNILGNIHEDAIVLDGFAGSGSIGIEFLSRGAKSCYFADISNESIKAIRDNLNHTKFTDQGMVFKKNLLVLIRELGHGGIKFDYIYLDPPFRKLNLVDDVLKEIEKSSVLSRDGMIIIEHEKELLLEDQIYDFEKTDFRSYGSKSITFYKKIN